MAVPDAVFAVGRAPVRRIPYAACVLVGLGGLFTGVTGPLVSTFVPPLVQTVLGNRRTAIGFVMAIDNVLLHLLVPLAGAASDRTRSGGRGRRAIVVPGLVLAAAGMALLPESTAAGFAGLIAGMILLFTGINVQRSPFQALVADLVPSRYRSLAGGSVMFQMCVGAIVFLNRPLFLIMAAYTALACAAVAFVPRGTGEVDDRLDNEPGVSVA